MRHLQQKHFWLATAKFAALAALIAVGLLAMAKAGHAQGYLGGAWDQYIRPTNTFPGGTEASGEVLVEKLIRNLIVIVRYLVGGVALLTGTIYGLTLVFSSGKEEVMEKQKKNFLMAFVGFAVLLISENVASIFNPEQASSDKLIDFGAAQDQLRAIVGYIKWILGSIVVLYMTITGARMVLASDQEEELTKHKESLVWGMVGLLVILLASNIVNAIYVVNEPREVVAAGAESAIGEISSIIRLILVFLGPLAIAFTLYAGFLYLTALDNDEQVQKSKRMIAGGVTGIAIIYAAYALVNTFTAEPLTASALLFASTL